MNARLIWIFEKLGWVSNVRWPKLDRLQGKMVEPAKTHMGSATR
jgi:stearoyl-CoA desaturase (delta-9 desaturase)